MRICRFAIGSDVGFGAVQGDPGAETLRATAKLVEAAEDRSIMRADIRLETDTGELVATVTGLVERRVTPESVTPGLLYLVSENAPSRVILGASPHHRMQFANGAFDLRRNASALNRVFGESLHERIRQELSPAETTKRTLEAARPKTR